MFESRTLLHNIRRSLSGLAERVKALVSKTSDPVIGVHGLESHTHCQFEVTLKVIHQTEKQRLCTDGSVVVVENLYNTTDILGIESSHWIMLDMYVPERRDLPDVIFDYIFKNSEVA